MNTIFVNWKTTAFGIFLAAAQLYAAGGITWKSALAAAAAMALGASAKDSNVTGGTVPNK